MCMQEISCESTQMHWTLNWFELRIELVRKQLWTIANMNVSIYIYIYMFYVLCFLLVLPFIYLFQVHNLTLARCFLLAMKFWRKSEIIEFVHKIWRCYLWESAKDGSPKRAPKKDRHGKGRLKVLSYVPMYT